MTCEKCGGSLDSSGKCIICGYDRETSNQEFAIEHEKELKKRSTRLIVFTAYQIITCLILILISIYGLSAKQHTLQILFLSFSVTRIVLCAFVFFYKKWAFYTLVCEYVIYLILDAVVYQSLIMMIIDIFVNVTFYFWIVSKDWYKFR